MNADVPEVAHPPGALHLVKGCIRVDLVIEVPASDVALVGEEQVAAQSVQALSLVQLAADSPPEFFVGDVAAQVDGTDGRIRAVRGRVSSAGCLRAASR